MDPVRNPFAPGAGNPPPELAGRSAVVADIDTALRRIAIGRPAQSAILVGLRGVGKTVLLNRIKELAESLRYRTILIEAHEGKTLPQLLGPGLKAILLSLSFADGSKDLARRGLRTLKSFLNGLNVSMAGIDIGLHVDPDAGTADSGDLESDLPTLLVAVAEAAKSNGRPVAILIDELQYLNATEFSALIMSIHRINQSNLPLTLVGAGLPQILALAGDSKSYAERLFKFPGIGALTEVDAMAALEKPAHSEGVVFHPEALDTILSVTERYPYFLQQWAHDAWNVAKDDTITLADVQAATEFLD